MSDEALSPREGAFDEQLSLPAPFASVPEPIENIVKRDGRLVPFDARKIADAVYRAAQSVGEGDTNLSSSLASAVAIFLRKNESGRTLVVDRVHDAVERVLVEMGHLRTALAYVRYRDRRSRMRELREEGDPHAILRELADARRFREVQSAGLLVRTGSDTLAAWDADKISEALVRETGLEIEEAGRIAAEVEGQIMKAQIHGVTASLVRELVDVKLIEHGLEDYRGRHMRLGVPLYDAEQIICAPDIDELSHGRHPEATNQVLGARVKKEFALGRVYSPEIADAHLVGDICIHGLSMVDRIDSLVQPLATLIQNGSISACASRRARPADRPETLVAQMAGFTSTLQYHCSGPVAWDAVNVYFAPFLEDVPELDYPDFAKMFLYEFAFRGLTSSTGIPGSPTIGIACSIPDHLSAERALGPAGASTEKVYGDYLSVSGAFASALLHAYGRVLGVPGMAPLPHLEFVCPRVLDSESVAYFIEPASEIAIGTDRLRIRWMEGAPFLPHTEDINRPRDVVAHRVTLNLPRCAYGARSEEDAFKEVEQLVDVAVRAHLEKRTFLRRLFSLMDAGPLALFSSGRAGFPRVDLEGAVYVVGICGLNECVQAVLGKELHESEDAMVFAEELLARVRDRCAAWSDSEHLSVVSGVTADAETSRRFAEIDLARYPVAAGKTVKSWGPTFEARYTPGAELNAPEALGPLEHVRREGRLHPLIGHGAVVRLPAPDPAADPSEVVDLIVSAGRETSAKSILFGR